MDSAIDLLTVVVTVCFSQNPEMWNIHGWRHSIVVFRKQEVDLYSLYSHMMSYTIEDYELKGI